MIEVNELVIRATVIENGRDNSRPNSVSSSGSVVNTALSDDEKAALIEDCVRQVLRILERQHER